ncbi:MAG: hypothetical protein CMF43_00255 [Legionellales bacterium]|nr:hypothetical protein [Legionellales bacterium]|tara:strand:- start:841 stop:1878 length:1038 start_codon:yes stop_codon:yes gene_type:complete
MHKKPAKQPMWIWFILFLSALYFILSAIFIFMSSYTTYRCPGQYNTPSNWSLPERWRSEDGTSRYPNLDPSSWQTPNYQLVRFPSRMPNVQISAWHTVINADAPSIIVVHGIRPNCKSVYESLLVSGMLSNAGFNVLNIDLQNYGESTRTSRFIAYGQREYLDVLGAYDWLITQGQKPNKIGIAGLSLGAVTTAIAASKESGIRAIWLDSPYADFNKMFCDELNSKYLPCLFSFGVRWLGQTFLGISPDAIKTTDVLNQKNTPAIYLTHGTADKRIPVSHAYTFIEKAKNQDQKISIWIVENSDHLDAMLEYPRLYQQKMVEFFTQALIVNTQKAQDLVTTVAPA